MELIAVSSSQNVENEVSEVVKMFELGLTYFHVRKPKMSRKEVLDYIKAIPEEYHKRLVLHSYHSLAEQLHLGGIHLSRSHRKRKWMYKFRLWIKRKINPNLIVTRSFHKLTDLGTDKRTYTYAFLSPVFDSVSQNSLGGGYSRRALLIMIPQARQPIYAMGGVHPDNLDAVAELGFPGAVMLGSLWKSVDPPHEIFKRAVENAKRLSPQS